MKQTLINMGALTVSLCATASEKPNLLIIHTDEHSFRTLSCYQQLMSEDQAFIWGKGVNSTTPNIDRIARRGAVCMNYYAATPVSTPSRAAFVTGLYPHATGAWKNGLPLREDIPTFATELTKAGYSTSYIGKWHLSKEHEGYAFDIIEYNGGFSDNTYMTPGGHAPYLRMKNGKIIASGISQNKLKGIPKSELVHYTDFYTDRTIEIIERDKDKPFCIMVSIPDPHTPDYATGKYHTMYNHLKPTPPATMNDELMAQRPLWAGTEKNNVAEFEGERLKQYLGMVKHIDDAVGRMLASIEGNGLANNTIIIFTSDHGEMFYEHNRMNKGNPYEAAARVPFVISYPGKIPAGKVITSNYVNVNFAPTILSLMGIETDATFQGVNTASDFTSKNLKVTTPRFTHFAASNANWACAVEGQYKLVLDKEEMPWLIDLKADPNELTNFAQEPEYKDIAKKMSKKLLKRLKRVDAPQRQFNTQGL